MKRLEELDEDQKGILRFLGREDEAENLEGIRKYLHEGGYGSLSEKGAREKIDELIDLGYVRAKIKGSKSSREEKFYLTRGIGAGRRARATLQGRTYFFGDLAKWGKRMSGAVLVLFGLGVFVYQGTGLSGAVISVAELKSGNFILPLSSLLLGGLLLFKSLSSKPTKKKKK